MTAASSTDSVSSVGTSPAAARASSRRTGRILKRAAIGVTVGALGFTAFMGVLHTSVGRPLLQALFPSMACPVQQGTPQQIDKAHAMSLQGMLGTTAAPSRAALGFTLDKTTLSDFVAWSESHHLTCEKIGGNDLLRTCADVPPEAVSEPAVDGLVESLELAFRSNGTLTSVAAKRRRLTPAAGGALFKSRAAALQASLGAPTTSGGNPAALGTFVLAAALAEYKFSDYVVELRAANLGPPTDVMVMEHYISGNL